MAKLIQLPDGTWIDPEGVTSVTVLRRFVGKFDQQPDRAVVHSDGKPMFVIPFATYEEAASARDSIAAAVNAAAEPKGERPPPGIFPGPGVYSTWDQRHDPVTWDKLLSCFPDMGVERKDSPPG